MDPATGAWRDTATTRRTPARSARRRAGDRRGRGRRRLGRHGRRGSGPAGPGHRHLHALQVFAGRSPQPGTRHGAGAGDRRGRHLWVGTDGGGSIGSSARRTASSGSSTCESPDDAGEQSRVLALSRPVGHPLVGTYGSGVSRCDLNTKPFLITGTIRPTPIRLAQHRLVVLRASARGAVGRHQRRGLNRLERRPALDSFPPRPNNANSLAHNSVRMVIADRAGSLWVATNAAAWTASTPDGTFRTSVTIDGTRAAWRTTSFARSSRTARAPSGWARTVAAWTSGIGHRRVHHIPLRFPASHDDLRTTTSTYRLQKPPARCGSGRTAAASTGSIVRRSPSRGIATTPAFSGSLSNDFVFSIHEDRRGRCGWPPTGRPESPQPADGAFTAIRKADGLPTTRSTDPGGPGGLALAEHEPRAGAVRPRERAVGTSPSPTGSRATSQRRSYYRNARGEMFFGASTASTCSTSAITTMPSGPGRPHRFRLFDQKVPSASSRTADAAVRSTHRDRTHRSRAQGPASSRSSSRAGFAVTEKNQYATRGGPRHPVDGDRVAPLLMYTPRFARPVRPQGEGHEQRRRPGTASRRRS